MAKIVIFGASGMIGQRAVREALGRGDTVTGVARDAARITDEHPGLTKVAGDAVNEQLVAKLAAGADAVIVSIGPPRTPEATLEDKRAAMAGLFDSVLGALRSLGGGAPRLIVVGGASSLLVGGTPLFDLPGFPDAYKSEAQSHIEVLERLRGVSDVQWTYLSPAAEIAPGERTGVFRLGGDDLLSDPDGKSFISAEDFAVALIDEAEKPQHVGRRFCAAY
ncbi:MAG TPA: NAD(P)H-binding protein [Actinocrinis sp.]